jgi:hypothetical protein
MRGSVVIALGSCGDGERACVIGANGGPPITIIGHLGLISIQATGTDLDLDLDGPRRGRSAKNYGTLAKYIYRYPGLLPVYSRSLYRRNDRDLWAIRRRIAAPIAFLDILPPGR